ncbi:MAG: DUF5110 domain-containing protein [Nitrospirae bacterium]|nr:DUF5110 domain-containing protein [Nitrospirota bacterium]
MKTNRTAMVLIVLLLVLPSTGLADVERVKYRAAGQYLVVEVLDDDLIHLEYGEGAGPGTGEPLGTTEMVCSMEDGLPAEVCRSDYAGPSEFSRNDGTIVTRDIRLEIDTGNLYVTVIDRTKSNLLLTTIRPLTVSGTVRGLIATRTEALDVYGLGQQFVEPGNSDIDWDGRVREGGPFGNVMSGFNGGANGNTQIPVMYAVNGASFENYALFFDNKYRQRWDFTSKSQWKVETSGGEVRFYVMTGPDLLDLRKDYMELTGHPLVPPKKMFGLWISEYGYDNWAEMEGKLASLREEGFPVDGFVLDLQWFGGIRNCSDDTRMGSLTFDEDDFPDPAGKLGSLKEDQGIGVMLIEEAYVGRSLPEHAGLKGRGCLVKERPGSAEPAYLTGNCWWGKGGMIDYTDDSCGAYWHDMKRKALIDLGIMGHWTDLGEPEMYDPGSGYSAGTQADAHNIFNFRWLRSIYKGYVRNNESRRPFMMSRSGTAGIQRFGAAMWSGDIASRLSSLAAHAANQMHMSFSGIDYYGADIGGFHRNLEGDLNEMYTQWYGYGMMFDIPGRPHVENLCNCKETAPDRIGDTGSNLANTRLRYSLIPYVYSLAHRAYLFGEPLMPPPVLYYQDDANLRSMGHEKMIGRDLLAAIVARHGETERDVYLPEGTWIDWYSNRRIDSRGEWITDVPVYADGRFRLPLYAREGAIIPLMPVDEATLNAFGRRSDGEKRNELTARVFALDLNGPKESEFTLYEDDGETIDYQRGLVRTTRITQRREGDGITVTVHASEGTYDGAPGVRNNLIELVVEDRLTPALVTLNGEPLTGHTSMNDFNTADSGWIESAPNIIKAKSGVMDVSTTKQFVFSLTEVPCSSSFASVSVPGEGNGWNPADADRTLSCSGGKTWKGRVRMSCEQYKFAADGSWRTNWGADGKQDGPNFPAVEGGIYEVTFNEDDPAHPLFRLVEGAPCSVRARFICDNGHTTFGTSVYVLGNITELGAWRAEDAVRLAPDGPYPRWTGVVDNLPPDTRIEWKCIKRLESGGPVLEWEGGMNNMFNSPSSGAAEDQYGSF